MRLFLDCGNKLGKMLVQSAPGKISYIKEAGGGNPEVLPRSQLGHPEERLVLPLVRMTHLVSVLGSENVK